jgi:hypothetical protein
MPQEIVTGSFNMKRDPMGHEPDRNDWLGKTLRRSPAAAPDACLDAETLAAWADGKLNGQAAAAVETHASSCPRCMAVLAAMERTAPAVPVQHAWTPARLFRWLVPIAAAATAVAIWVIVPNRPATVPVAAPVEESQAASARSDADTSAQPIVPAPAPELGARNQKTAPIQDAEPQVKVERQLRDEFRERRTNEAMRPPAAAAPSAAPSEPPSAPMAAQAPAAPAAQAQRAAKSAESADVGAVAGGAGFLSRIAVTSESTATVNQLFRWRVMGGTEIERSSDGGKTWRKVVPPSAANAANPSTILNIRAVDDLRAVARTSGGTEFYTVDGGLAWTPVQENSKAPF